MMERRLWVAVSVHTQAVQDIRQYLTVLHYFLRVYSFEHNLAHFCIYVKEDGALSPEPYHKKARSLRTSSN